MYDRREIEHCHSVRPVTLILPYVLVYGRRGCDGYGRWVTISDLCLAE